MSVSVVRDLDLIDWGSCLVLVYYLRRLLYVRRQLDRDLIAKVDSLAQHSLIAAHYVR